MIYMEQKPGQLRSLLYVTEEVKGPAKIFVLGLALGAAGASEKKHRCALLVTGGWLLCAYVRKLSLQVMLRLKCIWCHCCLQYRNVTWRLSNQQHFDPALASAEPAASRGSLRLPFLAPVPPYHSCPRKPARDPPWKRRTRTSWVHQMLWGRGSSGRKEACFRAWSWSVLLSI